MVFVVAQMLIVARIIAHFGATFSKTLTLSVVIPALIYCSDVFGAHADSMIMRSVSMGMNVRLRLRRNVWASLLSSLVAATTLYTEPTLNLVDINLALLVIPSLFVPEVFASPVTERIPLLPDSTRVTPTLAQAKKTTIAV